MEKTKAIIEFVKTLFIITVTAFFSIIGYLFINFETLNYMKKFILIYVIILLSGLTITLMIIWIKKIKKLKE